MGDIRQRSSLQVKIPARSSPAAEAEITTAAQAENGEPLSPIANVLSPPNLNCCVILFLGFGKTIAADELKAALEASVVCHPRFSSVLVTPKSWSHEPQWVRTKVSVDNHVFFPELGPAAAAADAGDHAAGDKFVEDYAASLCHSPLDPSRPLWDLHFLSIRTSEAAAVAIFRIHHSLGDGVSLISLIHEFTRRTSDFESFPTLPETRRRPPAATSGFGIYALLLRLRNMLEYARNSLVDVSHSVASSTFLKDTKIPIMASEGAQLRPELFVHRTISLDDVKGIKNTMGCTINDVLLGVTSAALSRYLSRSSGGHLPKNLRIRASMPVNIRPIPGTHALADMLKRGSESRWGNHIGYVLVRLPVMKCDDPLDYVRKAKATADGKKKSWAAKFSYNSALLVSKSLGIKAATRIFYNLISGATLTISNTVGPIEKVGLCGSPLLYIAPTAYGHPQALTVNFLSYVNKMKVVLAVEKFVIPDPHNLLDDITHSLQAFKESAARKS